MGAVILETGTVLGSLSAHVSGQRLDSTEATREIAIRDAEDLVDGTEQFAHDLYNQHGGLGGSIHVTGRCRMPVRGFDYDEDAKRRNHITLSVTVEMR